MPGEDKNFGGSLVLDFRKWWRHVKTIYILICNICYTSCVFLVTEGVDTDQLMYNASFWVQFSTL